MFIMGVVFILKRMGIWVGFLFSGGVKAARPHHLACIV